MLALFAAALGNASDECADIDPRLLEVQRWAKERRAGSKRAAPLPTPHLEVLLEGAWNRSTLALDILNQALTLISGTSTKSTRWGDRTASDGRTRLCVTWVQRHASSAPAFCPERAVPFGSPGASWNPRQRFWTR